MYRGSFSVADPNGNIARWLDRIPDIYQRTSTHSKPYQNMIVDGHLNMPRGLDVPTGMGGLFNGMRTFHYFTLPDLRHLQDAGGSGHNRRLFLKCETYGIFCSTAHFHPFLKADAKSPGMKTRSYRFGDIMESIQHGGSLLVSKFTSKTANGIRKEDLPESVASAIYNATNALRKAGFPLVADRVYDGVMDGGGVKLFIDNMDREFRAMSDEDALRVMKVFEPHLEVIDNEIAKLNSDMTQRMGNEIMLDVKDFLPIA